MGSNTLHENSYWKTKWRKYEQTKFVCFSFPKTFKNQFSVEKRTFGNDFFKPEESL